MDPSSLKFWLDIIADIAIIATAIFVFVQMRAMVQQVEQMAGMDERKRARAFDYIDKWRGMSNKDERSNALELLRDGKVSRNDKVRRLGDGIQMKNGLMEELWLLEDMALAITKKTADEQLLGDFFKSIVCQRYRDVRDFVDEERKSYGDDAFLKNFGVR